MSEISAEDYIAHAHEAIGRLFMETQILRQEAETLMNMKDESVPDEN